MTITETLKRRFVKDTNLPIRVFEEPYFTGERFKRYYFRVTPIFS